MQIGGTAHRKQTVKPMSVQSDYRMISVLHVDDQPTDRKLVRDILSAYGHGSAEACSGIGALATLAHQHFDLVLMDISMPGMDGLEAVRLLRRSLGHASITPVIACTADTRHDGAYYLARGFDGLLTKPFAIDELLQTIGACVATPVITRAIPDPWLAAV